MNDEEYEIVPEENDEPSEVVETDLETYDILSDGKIDEVVVNSTHEDGEITTEHIAVQQADLDHDGVYESSVADINNDGTSEAVAVDTDLDGRADLVDHDADGQADEVPDVGEPDIVDDEAVEAIEDADYEIDHDDSGDDDIDTDYSSTDNAESTVSDVDTDTDIDDAG